MLNMQLEAQRLQAYANWRHESIRMMKDKLQFNVAARSKKVEEVVNEGVTNINKELHLDEALATFSISNHLILTSLQQMYGKLDKWNGVNIASCKRKPSTFDEYWYIADNWWNRQKGAWFGDCYFDKLFQSLYQYCNSASPNHLLYRDLLFYNILHDIFNANVCFKRARPQPLLFDQSLEKSADLKQYFMRLCTVPSDYQKHKKGKKQRLRDIVFKDITAIKDRKFMEYCHHKQCLRRRNNNPACPRHIRPPQYTFGCQVHSSPQYSYHRQPEEFNTYRPRIHNIQIHQNERYQPQQHHNQPYSPPVRTPERSSYGSYRPCVLPMPIDINYARSTPSNAVNTTPISLCSTVSVNSVNSPLSFPHITPTNHQVSHHQTSKNSNQNDQMNCDANTNARLCAEGVVYGDDDFGDLMMADPFFGIDTAFPTCYDEDGLSVFDDVDTTHNTYI